MHIRMSACYFKFEWRHHVDFIIDASQFVFCLPTATAGSAFALCRCLRLLRRYAPALFFEESHFCLKLVFDEFGMRRLQAIFRAHHLDGFSTLGNSARINNFEIFKVL